MEQCQRRKDVSEFWRGKRDDRRMNPEQGVSAHDLHVSIFKVKSVVASSRVFLAIFDLFTELGWGQVRYGGDAQCRGGNCASRDIDEIFGRRLQVKQDGGKLDILQDGGRKSDVDRIGREILGDGSDGSFNLCRHLGGHRLLVPSNLTSLSLLDIPFLLFVFPPQPSGVNLSKFLAHKLGTFRKLEREQPTIPLPLPHHTPLCSHPGRPAFRSRDGHLQLQGGPVTRRLLRR
jgi:hypothetical protein